MDLQCWYFFIGNDLIEKNSHTFKVYIHLYVFSGSDMEFEQVLDYTNNKIKEHNRRKCTKRTKTWRLPFQPASSAWDECRLCLSSTSHLPCLLGSSWPCSSHRMDLPWHERPHLTLVPPPYSALSLRWMWALLRPKLPPYHQLSSLPLLGLSCACSSTKLQKFLILTVSYFIFCQQKRSLNFVSNVAPGSCLFQLYLQLMYFLPYHICVPTNTRR